MGTKLQIDAKTLISFIIQEMKKTDGFYGPVYARLAAKSAVKFVAKRIGDSAPPSIETIEEARDYIMKNLDKYPDGFCGLIFGGVETENMLAGSIGSGSRAGHTQAAKSLLGRQAKTGRTINIIESLKSQIEMVKATHVVVALPDFVGDENSALGTVGECHARDACEAIVQKDIRKVGGGLECVSARACLSLLEIMGGGPYDFELLEFNPSQCKFQIFRVQ